MIDSNVLISYSWNSEQYYLLEANCQQVAKTRFDIELKVCGCLITKLDNVFVTSYNHLFWYVYRYFRKAKYL